MKTKQEYISEISEASEAKNNMLLRQALSDPGIRGTDYVEIRSAYEARCEHLAENRQKPTNDEGINRRNIPVNFMDYIAQKHGYDAFTDIKKKSHFSRISAEIKECFSQTGTTIRKPYSTKTQIVLRGDDETPLDFAIRIDNLMLSPKKRMLSVPGDAETLSLSDLNPELVKQVATELLELEKTAKYQVHDEYVVEVDDTNKRTMEKILKFSTNYSTPLFGMKTFNRSVADANLAMQKWREALDAFYNNPATIARRYGQMLSDAIPKKHAFVQETGPEQIIDRTGKTRIAPADLKIETNQQWSPEELKDWLQNRPGNTQQIRKPYVFHEDKIRKANSIADAIISDAYATARAFSSEPQDTETLKDHQGNRHFWPAEHSDSEIDFKNLTGRYPTAAEIIETKRIEELTRRKNRLSLTEIHIRNYTPDNWPPNAPPYHTPEGWEFEKAMKRRQLKSMLTIEWLEKQRTEKHALVAKRLREILVA